MTGDRAGFDRAVATITAWVERHPGVPVEAAFRTAEWAFFQDDLPHARIMLPRVVAFLDGISDARSAPQPAPHGDPRLPEYTLLTEVTQRGWLRDAATGRYTTAALAALALQYSPLTVDVSIREPDPASLENVVGDAVLGRTRWVDLDGEGTRGLLTDADDA